MVLALSLVVISPAISLAQEGNENENESTSDETTLEMVETLQNRTEEVDSTELENSETPEQEERNIQYTNQLFNVTDQGVYDASGNIVDPKRLPELEAPGPRVEDFSLSPIKKESSSSLEVNDFDQYKSTLTQSWNSQANFAQAQLSGVQQDIYGQENRLQELETLIEQTQTDLEPIEKEIASLENQLNLYNDQISRVKAKITIVENKIAEKTVALKQLILELDELNKEFEVLKEVASDFILLLYEQTLYSSSPQDQSKQNVQLLLDDQTLGEQQGEISYLETMEETGRQVFHRLESKRREAIQKQEQVQQERLELDYLLKKLTQEKQNLEQIRKNKTTLLEQTQEKEEEYQKLLEESKKEQEALENELSGMKDIANLIQNQLIQLQRGLSQVQGASSESDLAGLSRVPGLNLTPGSSNLNGGFQVDPELLELMRKDLDAGKQLGLNWPVTPNKVTAVFSDSGYIKTFGVAHNATDIRAAQGSNVYAAADGMVVKISPANSGRYAQVTLAHGKGGLPPGYTGTSDGLLTLYGHMSQIDVKVGDIVRRGDIIGFSGGMPGTTGAGLRTTGAHMHFEVWENGRRVDPLEFLILKGVPDQYLPANFRTPRDRKYWPENE